MTKLVNKMCFKALAAKDKALNALRDEKGETNLVAIILILAVVIALVIIFKDYLVDLFDSIWTSIFGDAESAMDVNSNVK